MIDNKENVNKVITLVYFKLKAYYARGPTLKIKLVYNCLLFQNCNNFRCLDSYEIVIVT